MTRGMLLYFPEHRREDDAFDRLTHECHGVCMFLSSPGEAFGHPGQDRPSSSTQISDYHVETGEASCAKQVLTLKRRTDGAGEAPPPCKFRPHAIMEFKDEPLWHVFIRLNICSNI